jgi:hypothetical protein
MGWKSGKTITRVEAQQLITNFLFTASNTELEKALYDLGFGEDRDKAYCGYNLGVSDVVENEEELGT